MHFLGIICRITSLIILLKNPKPIHLGKISDKANRKFRIKIISPVKRVVLNQIMIF